MYFVVANLDHAVQCFPELPESSISHTEKHFYRPRSEASEGYVFTGICLSISGGGPALQARQTPPANADPPPRQTPPAKANHPLKGRLPCQGRPPKKARPPTKADPPPAKADPPGIQPMGGPVCILVLFMKM